MVLPWVSESAAEALMADPKVQPTITNAAATIRLRAQIRRREIPIVSSFAVTL
jgi:hypothetical protein